MFKITRLDRRRVFGIRRSITHSLVKHAVRQTERQAATSTQSDSQPFSSIPGPTGFPYIGNLLGAYRGGAMSNKMHSYICEQHRKYGPIFKEKLGPGYSAVFLTAPTDIEAVVRHEGKYPDRPKMAPWVEYRKQSGQPMGIVLA